MKVTKSNPSHVYEIYVQPQVGIYSKDDSPLAKEKKQLQTRLQSHIQSLHLAHLISQPVCSPNP